jgi:hypothetical protein
VAWVWGAEYKTKGTAFAVPLFDAG